MASGNKSYTRTLKTNISQAWWHTPVTQEAEAGFEAGLGYRVKLCVKNRMCCLYGLPLVLGGTSLELTTGPSLWAGLECCWFTQ